MNMTLKQLKRAAKPTYYGDIIPTRVADWHWRRHIASIWPLIQQGIRSIIRCVPIPKVFILAGALFLMACGVVFTLSVGQQAVPPTYTDPFARYDKILPGQSSEALPDYDCGPYFVESVYISRNVPYLNCEILPTSGPIERITVVREAGMINHLAFEVTGLEYADVIQRWGPPDVLEQSQQFYIARWKSGVYVRGDFTQAFSYHAPIQIVIVSQPGYFPDDVL